MLPVIAIFDVGKTNKKRLLFDEQYQLVDEQTETFAEITDEDDDPCEDLDRLIRWLRASLADVLANPAFEVRAVNVTTYGASFVHINAEGQPVTPLYNYLKPFPEALHRQFFDTYGGETAVSRKTASPILGMLNSGLQIYRLKYEQPDKLAQAAYCLHLPQFVSFLINKWPVSELTSVGCHTMLWDFDQQQYHRWLTDENIDACLPQLVPSDSAIETFVNGNLIPVGVGLHDSSAALIPYLSSFQEPFVLLSTGTWCVSMNPFNASPLTDEELQYDCLCFLSYQGKPVKASRLFAGYEHEGQTKRLAEHFGVSLDTYKSVAFEANLIHSLRARHTVPTGEYEPDRLSSMKGSLFGGRDLDQFASYAEAYHQLMLDIVAQQLLSTELVLAGSPVRQLFVDGGFGKNPVYMHLLAAAFPDIEVYAASVAQATSLGAALAIHHHWNKHPLPTNCISLKRFENVL